MDWRSVGFDWNRARAFLITAQEGSLSAAARALGMTQPTLGRQVSALEVELGVALFERGGRGLELTPSGLELVEHVRAMGDAASRLSLTASRPESFSQVVSTPSSGEPRSLRALRYLDSSYGVRVFQQRYSIRIHLNAKALTAAW